MTQEAEVCGSVKQLPVLSELYKKREQQMRQRWRFEKDVQEKQAKTETSGNVRPALQR